MKKKEILEKYNLSRGAYHTLINLGKIKNLSKYDNEIIDEEFIKSFDYEKYKQDYHNSDEYKQKISERNSKVNEARWSNISNSDRELFKSKVSEGVNRHNKEHPESIQNMRQNLKEYWSNQENRDIQSKRMTEIYSDALKRNNIKEGCKKYWSDENNKQAQSKRMKSYWKEHPEKVEQNSKSNKLTFKLNKESGKLDEILSKIYNTKRQNNSFNTSQPEQYVKQLLEQKFKNVHYQYRSDKYPFNCDFYIEDLDLYIECNFSWLHGSKPYDENDEECVNLLKDWEIRAKTSDYYKNAIYTWTDLDVRKLKIFKENNLNYKIFYNLDDFNSWFNLKQTSDY